MPEFTGRSVKITFAAVVDEQLRRDPLCPKCGGRSTAWVPESEDSPREVIACFTCEPVKIEPLPGNPWAS